MDFAFDKNIFLKEIDLKKNGVIIYNDNLSFAIFSGSGIIEKEVVKKDYLKEKDLENAVYYIAKKDRLNECRGKICIIKYNKRERKMEKRAEDNNFVLYEFN